MTDIGAWLVAHGSTWAELLGFVSGVLCVYLVTRESIWNWPLAIATSACYIVVFRRLGYYSDTGLQVVYLLLSLYGWWHWTRGSAARRASADVDLAARPDSAPALAVSRTPAREMLLLAGAGVLLWLLLWTITSRIPGAKLPLLDASLAATSLVAQYMMTRKYLENWLLWIIADVVYVGLFVTRGNVLTAVLYAVYLLLAIIGMRRWTRALAMQHS
jgi:nicotinamide mononucleotide transporter